ncbi:hypothetical protein [Halomarina ordinaria]|uniref:Nucleotide-diphospho-sugar transferase domain-containing protein n=1 Tax=Halomarina ordinaria TaxID=3033939 RepID=A0ABD5U730_9EURY|nr:hypothetical protein [Halomarina sp. PSRA2]
MHESSRVASSERGILYIATEQRFVEEATVSARSARASMGDIPIAIITDSENDVPSIFDITIESSDNSHDFGEKVYNISKSPFDRTIYLDTDIHVEDDISELFDILGHWDLAAAHNISDYDFGGIEIPPDHPLTTLPMGIPEYNTGLIAYCSNSHTDNLFKEWVKAYEYDERVMEHPPDQASFKRALFESDTRVHTLSREYNCLFRSPGCVSRPVKVFHGRLIDLEGHGASKSADVRQAVDEINRQSGKRVYFTGADTTIVVDRLSKNLVTLLSLIRKKKFAKVLEVCARRLS